MKDNIIEFRQKESNLIQFTKDINNDPYLKLTCLNALEMAGYPVSTEGVKQFQADNNHEPTGIITISDLILLVYVFKDNDKIQDILNYIKKYIPNNKPKSISKKNKTLLIIWSLLYVFIFVYGFFELLSNIISFMKNILF